MTCSVIRNPQTGKIEKVLAPNGEDSILFRSILSNVPIANDSSETALRLWAQVYTPQFKKWFGDWETSPETSSKAVDSNGEPIVVFHGTDKYGFSRFRKDLLGSNTGAPSAFKGFFFASNKEASNAYIDSLGKWVMNNLSFPDFEVSQVDFDAEQQYHAEDEKEEAERKMSMSHAHLALGEGYITQEQYEDLVGKPYVSPDIYSIFLNIRNPLVIDQGGIRKRISTYSDLLTRAINEGNDGVIILNTYDPEPSDIYVALEENQIKSVTNQGTFSSETPNIYEQSSGPIPSTASPKTLRLVSEFLRKAGFDVRKVNQVQVNGKVVQANGVADVLNRIVQVVDGKEDTVLPEEAMHVAVEMIEQQNTPLFNKMLNSISSYQMYSDIFATYQHNPLYRKDGKPDIRKIKKEAISRILVETIINQTEGSTEKPENLKKASDWWRTFLEWIKGLFTKYGSPFEEAAEMVAQSSLDSEIQETDEVFMQMSPDQTSEYDRLLEIHNSLVLVDDGGGNSHYEIDGRRVKNRVTDKTHTYYNRKFRSKQINESELSKVLNEQKREKGTDGHKDLENMFHRLIDDNGFVRDEPLNQGSPSNLNPSDNTFYNTLYENLRERISSYPAQTRFMAEVKIYDKATDTAGTIDFLAITPDGKYNILDWKFIDIREGEQDIPWYKREAWNIQLSEYKRILRESYNAKRDDFGQTRVIPIRAKYKFRPNTEDQLMLTSIQIGAVNVSAIQDNTVLPVPTRDETTGSKRLDDLIQGLYNLMDKIYETRSKPGEEYKKVERLNELSNAVRELHVKGATSDFLEFVYDDVRDRIYYQFQPFFKLLDIINSTKFSETEKQQAREQLNEIPNLNDLAREILDNEDILELYGDISKALRDVLDPFAQENKSIFQRAEEVVANANITRERLIDLSNVLRTNPIARGLNVPDVLDNELSVSFYQKWVRSLSQAATAATRMLWNIVNTINNRLQIEFSDEVSRLKELEREVSDYQKNKGKTWSDVEHMILNFNSKDQWNGKVISKVDQSFYTELEKAKLNKDIATVLDIIDTDAYEQWFNQELQNRIDSYANRRIRADEEEDRIEKEKRIEDFKKQFDIFNNVNTAISPANRMLNSFPNMSQFTSAKFKILQEPGNEPILKLYNYWLEKLDESYDLGLIKNWEKKTFFPNVRKDFLDKMVFGVNSSFGNRLVRGPKSVLDSISVQVDDDTFGYTDINGNPQDKLSALYTYDLGEKIIDEDGNEFTDYSNKSTDLFKVMALWNKEMIKYKHKSEVVDIVRLLHFTETNRKAQARSKISGKPATKRESGEPVLVDNVVNSEYYKNFMDYYFYGRRLSEGADVRFTIPYNKIANKINKTLGTEVIPLEEEEVTISGKKAIQATNRFFQMKTLGLNLSTALTNFFGGTTNVIVNSGKFFNKADFFKAQMIISSGKLWGSNSVYAGLIDYFIPLTEDRTYNEAEKLSVSRAVRTLSSDYLFYLQRQSDKMVQYPAFIAFAENTMVENGQLVNIREYVKQKHNYDNIYNLPIQDQKALNQTIEAEISSLKSTRSLPKIAQIQNDVLSIPDIERNSKTVHDLRNRVQQFSKDALGNMSEEDISQYRMTLLGQSFMMFKNWIPRMADVRFGEFRFQAGTDSYEWGRVRMLFSSLKYGILTGLTSLTKTLGGKNDGTINIAKKLYEQKKAEQERLGRTFDMSEVEFIDNYVKGVRSQMKEIILLMSLTGLLFYAKSQAPDPDDDVRSKGAYKWAVRLFDKMTDELGFFYNPLSFTAIANGSVFPSIQIVNDMYKVVRGVTLESLYLVTQDDEARENNKVAKYIFRTFPITKELTLYMAMFNEELAKEYGVRVNTESRRVY